MTDIEYIYLKDLREKKAAGRGIFGKRTGSKTRYVGLSQNHKTDAQLKRRNGPVQTYNISTLINDYKTFKDLPHDLKIEYLSAIQDTYRVSIPLIAESMGVSSSTFHGMLKRENIELRRFHAAAVSPDWGMFLKGLMTSRGKATEKAQCKCEPLPGFPPTAAKAEPAPVVEATPAEPAPVIESEPAGDKPKALSLPFRVGVNVDCTPGQLAELIAYLTDATQAYNFELVISQKGGEH